MSDTRIRVLGIGAGYFSQFHYEAWADHPEVELVGIVDPDAGRREALAERFRAPRTFAAAEGALDATAPDLVDIITPPPTHLGLVSQTLRRRILTICQKPLCGGLAGAAEAVALAERHATPLIVHENFRFQPWYRRIRAEIVAGRLGDVLQIAFRLRPGDGAGPRAYLDRQPYFQQMERLLVHETAVHFVDTFRYLMGDPDWVWADLRRLNPVIAGEDAGLIVFGYHDGRRALFDGNRLLDHAARDRRFTMGEGLVEGTAATIALDGDGGLLLRRHGADRGEHLNIATSDRFGGGCVAALQAHVVDHILRDAALENEAADYVRNLEIVEAIYASAARGVRIDVPRHRVASEVTL